jgi:AAA+ ATPase superfamily predicted ATPase
VNPKERKEDLYDREEELRSISEALNLRERLIIVYGIRRIGKTSLMRVSLRDYPHVLLDIRKLYFSENTVTMPLLVKYILEGFREQMKASEKLYLGLRDAISRIKGLRIGEIGIEIEPNAKVSLTDVLSRVNDWCEERGERFVFAFDEAQYLRFSNIRYDGIIAWAVDNLENLSFLLSGSEIGVLRDFLRIDEPGAPLFGRYRREVYVDRFTEEESFDFLHRGFRELGIEPKVDEIEDTLKTLDGIAGWLTLYGYMRAVRKLPHEDALAKVFEEGSKLVMEELDKVISPSRKRYLAIMKAVAHGSSSWSDIKAYVTARAGPIPDSRLDELLGNLIKYGYLEKNDEYRIPDPIVKRAVISS